MGRSARVRAPAAAWRRWAGPVAVLLLALASTSLGAQDRPWTQAPAEDWVPLFDGRTLDGWTPKIRGAVLGDDPARTFRVVDGVLAVGYDGYSSFDDRFGHLFWREPLSHYVLAVEARFVGAQMPDAPAWARLNSGVMVHAQPPETMLRDQDFPISIEVQLLAGEGGETRPTANLCTPGTHVERDGALVTLHCVDSASRTVAPGEWVRVEIVVAGSERIEHRVDGEVVLAYRRPQVGGGVVTGFDPAAKRDGEVLESGYIALQSEGHPLEIRRVALLPLRGCTDPGSPSFRSYFVASDPAACAGG
jgi:hypothetical protein